ncbi:U32 family peptidase [Ferrimonas balearica]|uniref:U32 family peptidase n=1 Tax=Ferrimonas balearica TaxID=44012 RepID=UPI001C996F99|nr:U32 family peptidase [Ferrimonas balearica]MBY5990626.1 U32 family peptidase [Ferrimonas balearica]
MTHPIRLSLAPNWWPMDRTAQHDHLDALLDSPFERLYLGESVCALRDRLAPRTLMTLARTLSDAGKEVVLTSLSLLAGPRDLALLESLCQLEGITLEANEMGAVGAAAEAGLPFVAGSGLNIYNLDSLNWLLELGMTTYQPPLEMAQPVLSALMAQAEQTGVRERFELELLGYGQPPLAVSARCATARVAGRNRKRCETVCQQVGAQPAHSLEGQPLLTLNGVQVHGDRPIDLLDSLATLRALKLDWLRLDPGPSLEWQWAWDLQSALKAGAERFDPPVVGMRQFWQRQQQTVALSND